MQRTVKWQVKVTPTIDDKYRTLAESLGITVPEFVRIAVAYYAETLNPNSQLLLKTQTTQR